MKPIKKSEQVAAEGARIEMTSTIAIVDVVEIFVERVSPSVSVGVCEKYNVKLKVVLENGFYFYTPVLTVVFRHPNHDLVMGYAGNSKKWITISDDESYVPNIKEGDTITVRGTVNGSHNKLIRVVKLD